MNQVDRLYRAFIDYRKQTVGAYDCDRARDAIAKTNEQDDLVTLERKICTVETDWIDAIEKGLVFIEKAIREERQFIRSNGEVLPIEKVKRVDKESVVHLARHSNLLTKEPEEGEDIIPDQLYTVERLSDYAVYENRFLYRLLCYLRDFVTLRYDKILELTTTYNGNLSLNKSVDYKKQKLRFTIQLSEQRRNDPYLREFNEAKSSIDRIDLILKAVIHYLNTPLMEEVSKAPMLKPPITKTNVLKMNQNFKGCMALYEYITAYNQPGYTVEEFKKNLRPFSEVVADEFAEAATLLSFLTYEHSLGMEGYLRENYLAEEERRKIEEGIKLREQIKKLKKRIQESGMSPEEYMLMLEKRNRSLENDSAQLVIANQEIERLKGEMETIAGTVASLEAEVQSLKDEIVAINAKHECEIADLHAHYTKALEDQKYEYEGKLETQKATYEESIAKIQEEHERAMAELKDDYTAQIDELKDNYTAQIDELNQQRDEERARFEQTILDTKKEYAQKEQTLYAEVDEKNKQLQAHKRECDEAVRIAKNAQAKAYEERVLFESRLNAMRFEYGLIEDENEFVPKIPFEELERQYHMLRKLFKQEWTKVKKDIRTRILWILFKRTIDDDDVLLGVNPTPQIPTEPTTVSTAEQVMDMTENLAVKVDTDAEDAVEETSEDVIEEVAVDAEDEFEGNLEDSDEEIEEDEESDEDESEEDEESDEEEDEADEEVEMAQTETEETKVSDAQEGIADTSSTDEE
ncbi:MAG: hypothetical protein E7371_01380 [Clostridiales bacterium]|nr:hypothetical protein [Clostridiales bacterium]